MKHGAFLVPFRVCGAGICCEGHQYYYFSANTELKPPGTPSPYAGGPRSDNQPAGYEYIDPAADALKYFGPPCKGWRRSNMH